MTRPLRTQLSTLFDEGEWHAVDHPPSLCRGASSRLCVNPGKRAGAGLASDCCLWGASGGGVGGTREARGGTGKERAGETDSGKAWVTRRALAPRSRLWPPVTEGGPYREGPRTRVFPRQSGASAAALRI